MLMMKPTRTMSCMLTRRVPKTMALGGVPTGSMKPSEELMAAGIMKRIGLKPMALALAAKMGRTTWAVAVLEVSSVRKVTTVQTPKTMIMG